MTTDSGKTFGVADFVVFGFLILFSIGIGVFFAIRGKHDNTTANYFLGNRKLKALPVALSFVVTFQSSIIILGFPAEAYAYGMQYAMQLIGVTIAYLLASEIVVPIFHPLKVTSVYEYYRLRYNESSVRYLAVVLGMIHYTFYMGIVMYGTALALESAANLPFWASILIFSCASVLYTSIGGFKAVIWTDVFQSLVMLIGILAVLIKSSMQAGGSGRVLKLSESRMNFFDFNPDPTIRHSFWTLVFGSITQFLYLTITQSGIQRINSTPNIRTAKIIFYIVAPVFSLTWILTMCEGLSIFAYFKDKGCDPLASGQIKNINQLIPFTMMELFHDLPGFPGLVIAALAAASLSTISSGLCSLTAVTYEDFIKLYAKNMKDQTGANISKAIVVVFGLIAVCFAFLLSNVEGPLGQIMSSFMGAISGPETGLYLTSVFFRRAKPKAMVIATLTGVGFILWISSGQNFSASIPKAPYLPLGPTDQCSSSMDTNLNLTYSSTSYAYNFTSTSTVATSTEVPPLVRSRTALQTFYSISYMYFNLMGTIIVIVVGTILSLVMKSDDETNVSEKVIIPLSKFVPSCLRDRCCKSNRKYAMDPPEVDELETMVVNKDMS